MKSNLKKILNENNISLNQLHKMTGISRTTLDPLLKNESIPNKTRIETLQKICKVLNISLSELAEEEVFYEVVNFQTVSKYGDFMNYKTDDMVNLFKSSSRGEIGTAYFEYILLIKISSTTSTVFTPCNLSWCVGKDRSFSFDFDVNRSRVEIDSNDKVIFFDRLDFFSETYSVLQFAKAIGSFLKKNSKVLKQIEYDYSNSLVDFGLEERAPQWYLEDSIILLYADDNIIDPYEDYWQIFKYDYSLSRNEIEYFKPKKISFRTI